MSKLVEKLKNVGESAPVSMGFGTASSRDRQSNMLVIGTSSITVLKSKESLRKAPVDAYLVSFTKGDESLSDVGEALGSLVWGVKPDADSWTRALQQLADAGGDFIVFTPNGAGADILLAEDLAKVIVVEGQMDEDTARGIDGLDIDGVVLTRSKESAPLTVRDLIDLQANRSLVSKYALLEISAVPDSNEVAAFRDIGIEGLVVDMEALGDDGLKALRSAIDQIPRRKSKSDKHASLPGARVGIGQSSSDDDEEDWD